MLKRLLDLTSAPNKLPVRTITVTNCYYVSNKQINLKDFTAIYKFPYIQGVSLVNRLKFVHTTLSAISIPVSLILNQLDIVTYEFPLTTVGLATSGCMFLYSIGFFTNNFIGMMYANQDKSIVQVSYADFWGRRKNIQVQIKDIVPFSEIPTSYIDNAYFKFKNYSNDTTLKINIKHGEVLDKEAFHKIFLI